MLLIIYLRGYNNYSRFIRLLKLLKHNKNGKIVNKSPVVYISKLRTSLRGIEEVKWYYRDLVIIKGKVM